MAAVCAAVDSGCDEVIGMAFYFPKDEELFEDLIADGVLIRNPESGKVALSYWESLRYDFNI